MDSAGRRRGAPHPGQNAGRDAGQRRLAILQRRESAARVGPLDAHADDSKPVVCGQGLSGVRRSRAHETLGVLRPGGGCDGRVALRRTDGHLNAMATALEAFATAVEEQRDAVEHDFQFHLQIAKATDNVRFIELMAALGGSMIPRARLNTEDEITPQRVEYLRRVNDEHADIFNAIQGGDTEGARFSMRAHLTNSHRRRRLSAPAR